jgi:hypothetical protein
MQADGRTPRGVAAVTTSNGQRSPVASASPALAEAVAATLAREGLTVARLAGGKVTLFEEVRPGRCRTC